MLWVVPPFLALTRALVLRLSAKVKSTAAAQQASALVRLPLIMVAYSQATGSLYGREALAWYIGALAWVLAVVAPWRRLKVVTRGRPLGVARSEERRVGKECGSTFRSWWTQS